MDTVQFIIYVKNQEKSKFFYEKLLQLKPVLHVPGMTEFQLNKNAKIGLMHEQGIAKILGDKMPNPALGQGVPRCEIYLKVNNAKEYILRGIENGAVDISAFQKRDWGDTVGYIADLDGHVLAFAEKK